MSGHRGKLVYGKSSNFHASNPYNSSNFIRNDNEFPSLSAEKTKVLNFETPKDTIVTCSPQTASVSYSSKLQASNKKQASKASSEDVFLPSKIQIEKQNNNNNRYFYSNQIVSSVKQTSNLSSSGYVLSEEKNNKQKNYYYASSDKKLEKKQFSKHSAIFDQGTATSKFSNFNKEYCKVSDTQINTSQGTKSDSSFNRNKNLTKAINSSDFKHDLEHNRMLQRNPNNASCVVSKNKANDHNELKKDASEVDIAKTKKNRKSKVKRQSAFQKGKIFVLTPEAHSRILNQSNGISISENLNTVVDINDDNEYPQLGQSILQKKIVNVEKPISNQKNKKVSSINFSSKENLTETHNEGDVKNENLQDSEQTAASNIHQQCIRTVSETVLEDSKGIKKKLKEEKATPHIASPITIPFNDMLSLKSKTKEAKKKPESSAGIEPTMQVKQKKTVCHAPNVLDSSSPAVKRGKEREKPKTKRKSQLKRIILMDRQLRKEQHLQIKEEQESITDQEETKNEVLNEDDSLSYASEIEDNLLLSPDRSDQAKSVFINCDIVNPMHNDEIEGKKQDLHITNTNESLHENTNCSNISHFNERDTVTTISLAVEDDTAKTGSEYLNLKEMSASEDMSNLLSGDSSDDIESDESEQQEVFIHDESQQISLIKNVDTEPCLDALFVNSTNTPIKNITDIKHASAFSEKEKLQAAKIVIHTRCFRQYCTHLISKEIDDAVLALLDDLARFQDRLHQKDPVKARMKRRLVYGIKEVMKHIKLRKLKCIVIAVNIENVETEGGLNDALAHLVSSASDHHVPCVYALTRKALGKVCHKPVPISCVGVFNYEGSEANFKKMVELQTQSQRDYKELKDSLMEKLDDVTIEKLLKTFKKSPESLQILRDEVLGDFFKT